VEAAVRSGSLISARMAGDMGRTVFAVPGSPLDHRARGTNMLLKQGATLVTEANDVIVRLRQLAGSSAYQTDMPTQPDLLSPAMEEPDSYQPIATEEQRDIVIDALGPVPTDIDTLVRHTVLDTGAIQLILLELDLAGRLHRYARNQVALVPLE